MKLPLTALLLLLPLAACAGTGAADDAPQGAVSAPEHTPEVRYYMIADT
jgi:hypothetical protein